MEIKRISQYSGKENKMDLPITLEQLIRWKSGELAQRVFPHLSMAEREFLITGMTPEEWDELYGDEE